MTACCLSGRTDRAQCQLLIIRLYSVKPDMDDITIFQIHGNLGQILQMGKVLWDQLHHHRITHTLPAQIMEAITKLIKDAASCVTVGTVTSTVSILILCWLKALAVKSKLAIWFYVGLIGFNNLRWLKAL